MSAWWKHRFQKLYHLRYLYYSGREQGREAEHENSKYKPFWGAPEPGLQLTSRGDAPFLFALWWKLAPRGGMLGLPHCSPSEQWWAMSVTDPLTPPLSPSPPWPVADCALKREVQELKQRSFLVSFLGSSTWFYPQPLLSHTMYTKTIRNEMQTLWN